jgi:hypothetical protein
MHKQRSHKANVGIRRCSTRRGGSANGWFGSMPLKNWLRFPSFR